jgi:hypothetical protein
MPLETAERGCDALVLEATGRGLPHDVAYRHDGRMVPER